MCTALKAAALLPNNAAETLARVAATFSLPIFSSNRFSVYTLIGLDACQSHPDWGSHASSGV